MEENYSEKIEKILKDAKEELDSLMNKYNEEVKPNMPGKEEFEKNLPRFKKALSAKIFNICLHKEAWVEKNRELYEEAEEIDEKAYQEVNEYVEKFGEKEDDEIFKSLIDDWDEAQNDRKVAREALRWAELELESAQNFNGSTLKYISADSFPKKCEECFKKLEEDLNFKKETECKELLTEDAEVDFVFDAVDPLKKELSNIIVYSEAYSSFLGDKCYVATAVYGSYDCPEVWTLRRYRDNELAKNLFGRAFIHTYYAISPTIVRYFGDKKWFKNMWRGKLDRMVKHLQARGFEDTPYNDREW